MLDKHHFSEEKNRLLRLKIKTYSFISSYSYFSQYRDKSRNGDL